MSNCRSPVDVVAASFELQKSCASSPQHNLKLDLLLELCVMKLSEGKCRCVGDCFGSTGCCARETQFFNPLKSSIPGSHMIRGDAICDSVHLLVLLWVA